MAEAARAAGAPPPHCSLPDEMSIWEILVRLPPKSLLRCRAVCFAWRRATSTRDFLLAHHARQPTLPLLYGEYSVGKSLGIIPFDCRAGLQQPVARLSRANGDFQLDASCDGLLVLSTFDGLSICNPATRQYACLPMPSGFMFLGIYGHQPTGEYRTLLYDGRAACHVFALGSGQPRRYIGVLPDELNLIGRPVMFSGRLHWHPRHQQNGINVIIVFDTIAESFHQMCAAVVPDRALLFEVDRMLGMSGFNDAGTVIDIWMMEDCVKLRDGFSSVELNCLLRRSCCSAESLAVSGVQWLFLVMAMCLCWSCLASRYFRLTWMASWLLVSISKALVFLNIVSNKLWFLVPSSGQ